MRPPRVKRYPLGGEIEGALPAVDDGVLQLLSGALRGSTLVLALVAGRFVPALAPVFTTATIVGFVLAGYRARMATDSYFKLQTGFGRAHSQSREELRRAEKAVSRGHE